MFGREQILYEVAGGQATKPFKLLVNMIFQGKSDGCYLIPCLPKAKGIHPIMMACNVYVVCGGVCDEKFGARYFQIGLMDSSVHGIQINHIERRNLFVLVDVRGHVRSPEVMNKSLIKTLYQGSK